MRVFWRASKVKPTQRSFAAHGTRRRLINEGGKRDDDDGEVLYGGHALNRCTPAHQQRTGATVANAPVQPKCDFALLLELHLCWHHGTAWPGRHRLEWLYQGRRASS